MNIGITINTSWNIYNFRENLLKSLLANGHKVYVIAPEDKYTKYLKEWGALYIPIDIRSTSKNPFSDFSIALRYKQIIRQFEIDVMLSYTIKPNIYASLAARFSNVKVICNVSGLGTVFLTKSPANFVARVLYRLAFKSTSYVFFQNEDDKREFTKTVSLPENKVGILPGSGIDLKKYQTAPLDFTKPVRFLMIARIIVEKGVYEYVRAATMVKQSFPDTEFVLIGKFDPSHSRSVVKSRLDRWSKKLISYKGETDNVLEEIRNAHCVVLPSYREGKPRTLLEGAACGRPLIATNVPGCKDLVQPEVNGYLCSVKSVESLAEAMMKFLELEDSKKEQFGRESRKMVEEQYDENIVIDQYQNIIASFE